MPETSLDRKPDRWPLIGRIGFRVAFCYLLLYAFSSTNANLLYLLPKLGAMIASWMSLATLGPATWLAPHLFRITGLGAKIHPTGSGDTAIKWIAIGVMLAYSLAAALIWSLFARRDEYRTAAAWLRFLIRLTLVLAMTNYGFDKLFPMQMPPPSLAVLNEPVGNVSPMTLLWTLIGFNPIYEAVCGAIEVVAAILLFFRRTALAGAILTFFVMGNVLLFNLFFDVPVKIYAAHLVLFSLVIIAPDLRSLWGFFWRHQPSAPSAPAVPPTQRRGVRIAIYVVEVFLILMVVTSIPGQYQSFARTQVSLHHPHPFTGEWRVQGQAVPGTVITGGGRPMTELFIEPNGRATLRDDAGVLWRAGVSINDKDGNFALYRDGEASLVYSFDQPDAMHLILKPSANDAATGALYLERVLLPDRYPLLDRGFHLVNEWPLER
jgi:hypothetical protein